MIMTDKGETYHLSFNHHLYFQQAVFDRLEEYGFPHGMTPQKYQAYCHVRAVMRLRLLAERGIVLPTGNQYYTDAEHYAGLEMLDLILPEREAHDER